MVEPKLNSLIIAVTLSLIALLSPSCVPVFSDLQSARTVGKGQFEATPYYTSTGKDSESKGASHLGANLAFGISDKVDLRAKIDQNWINGEDGSGVTVFGIGPKLSLVENKISFFLPVGTDFSSNWQMQPTMFFTVPFGQEKFEATLAPKYLINLCQDCGGNFATNLGLGYSPDFDNWALRAEYGRIIGDGGGAGQFSLGFSFHLNSKK